MNRQSVNIWEHIHIRIDYYGDVFNRVIKYGFIFSFYKRKPKSEQLSNILLHRNHN